MLAIRGRLLRTLAFLFIAIAALPATAPAQGRGGTPAASKLDPLLQRLAGQLTGRSRVIVEFNGTPDVRAITTAHGRPTRAMRNHPAHVADIANVDLLALAQDPRVARVMSDRPAFAMLERTGATLGLRNADTGLADVAETGRGIGIALVDSGINAQHDDLWRSQYGQRVVAFKDFTADPSNSWSNVPPRDGFGHGTHVAGILAGNGYDSSGRRRGIAPRAKLIALKALGDDGFGFVSTVIEAIDYAVANRSALGIRVINLSIGAGVFESYNTDPLTQAARRAVDAGIVVVTSAGNLGQNAAHQSQLGGITSPGNAPWVLTVGASSHQGTVSRADDTVAAFSSRGPTWIDFAAKPDVVAPGIGIESLSDPQSLLYSELQDYLLDGTVALFYKPYLSLSGTSMAAPVVAATVALMLEANPGLTPNGREPAGRLAAVGGSRLRQRAWRAAARPLLRAAAVRPRRGERHDRRPVDRMGAASDLGELPDHGRRSNARQQRMGLQRGMGRNAHAGRRARGMGYDQSGQRGVGRGRRRQRRVGRSEQRQRRLG
jgi:subtilisin family serine protease